MTRTEFAGESRQERDLDSAAAGRERYDERRMEQRQRTEEHYAEGRRVGVTPDECRQDQRARGEADDGEQRAREQDPPRRAPDVGERHAPLPPHAMPDGSGPHQALQRPDDDQHHEDDELDPQQVAGQAVRQEPVCGLAPIGHVVRGERECDDAEHRPFGRDLHAERHQPRHHAEPRPRHPEEPRGLPSQPIGRERGSRLAIQVQPQGVAKLEPAAGRPAGELNAPRARDAVNGQQQNGENVIQSEQSPSG